MIEPGPCKAAKRTKVDVHIVEFVVAGNQSGQHAGVRRVNVSTNQGDANPGHWFHAKALQHDDMTVATSDQDQVLDDRCAVRLHPIFLCRRTVDVLATSGLIPTQTWFANAGVPESYARPRPPRCSARRLSRSRPPPCRSECRQMHCPRRSPGFGSPACRGSPSP